MDCTNCHDRQIARQVAVDLLRRAADLCRDAALLVHTQEIETSATILGSQLRGEADKIART